MLREAVIASALALALPAPCTGADDLSGIKVAPGYRATVYASGLAEPRGLLFLPAGDLYVAEQDSDTVAKISAAGAVARVAKGFKGVHDLALGADGNIYAAEMHGDRVSVITPAGKVSAHIKVRSPV